MEWIEFLMERFGKSERFTIDWPLSKIVISKVSAIRLPTWYTVQELCVANRYPVRMCRDVWACRYGTSGLVDVIWELMSRYAASQPTSSGKPCVLSWREELLFASKIGLLENHVIPVCSVLTMWHVHITGVFWYCMTGMLAHIAQHKWAENEHSC